VLLVVGVLLAAFSPAFWTLIVARILIGRLAVGAASMTVSLCISEVAPPRIRGGLVSFNQLAITSGVPWSYPTKQRSLQQIERDLGAELSAEAAPAPTVGR
jgi:MFS family permease